MAAASNTPPPAQAQTKQEISNASLLRNPSKVIVLRVSYSLLLKFVQYSVHLHAVLAVDIFLQWHVCLFGLFVYPLHVFKKVIDEVLGIFY